MFLFDCKPISYCRQYKYLGSNINEFLDLSFTVDKHSDSAGRALSTIITKMIKNNGFPFNVFSMLYNACVNSIADYSGPFTGFQNVQSSLKVHLRAIRSFLGVPKNACTPAVLSEVELLMPVNRTKLQMIRHYHRLLKMDNTRLTKRIMLWDNKINDSKIVCTWSSEARQIFEECNMQTIYDAKTYFNKQEIISLISSKLMVFQKANLEAECRLKPKLRTFLKIKDFKSSAAYIL